MPDCPVCLEACPKSSPKCSTCKNVTCFPCVAKLAKSCPNGWPIARWSWELARDRHGFEPLNADAGDVFEQTEVLPRADAAAMGPPCQ